MNPRLVAVSGPHRGRSLPLDRDVFRIGRHAGSDLQVLDLAVSRRHCEIRRHGDTFSLRDLDSRHGTFVNTLPVRERELEHSDLLQIGQTALLFLIDAVADDRPSFDESAVVAGSTLRKRPEEAFYLQPTAMRSVLPVQARVAADLSTLVQISTAVGELREVEPLARRLVELLLDALPAQRGCVLLLETGSQDQRLAAARHRGEAGTAPFAVSRTILERVLGERVGLLCRDLQQEEGELASAESVLRAEIRSLLCVPLVGRERLLGALYFDSGDPVAFSEHHLELLTAAAGIAALAFENAFYVEWLRNENRRLRAEGWEHGMVGESPAMKRLLRFLERVAPADSTVLLIGESGTGKELAARAIHRASPRAEAPFVAVNCATLQETLLESELFGHEKGAFTGAVARQIGKLEAADHGTIFLDEVGEIPLQLQAKLLRALQEREFERVGSNRPIRVDVRVIAATNRDLERAIRDGKFREDLYYRLNVISTTMPPLRERRDDIPLLAQHFARLHGGRLKRPIAGLTPEAKRALCAYDWPGNVRQLANAIERAVVLGEDEYVQPEDLPEEVLDSGGAAASDYQARLVESKREIITDAFERAGGEYQAAAEILGLHVNSLHRLIRNLGLKEKLGK